MNFVKLSVYEDEESSDSPSMSNLSSRWHVTVFTILLTKSSEMVLILRNMLMCSIELNWILSVRVKNLIACFKRHICQIKFKESRSTAVIHRFVKIQARTAGLASRINKKRSFNIYPKYQTDYRLTKPNFISAWKYFRGSRSAITYITW